MSSMKRTQYLNRTRLDQNLISQSLKLVGNTSIDQQCILIKQQSASMATDNLTTSFDTILMDLNKSELLTNVDTIEKIVITISSSFVDHQQLFETNLLDHKLFIIFRDLYLNILCRWRRGEILNRSTRRTLCQISSMFTTLFFHATDSAVNSLRNLLIYQPLIDELNECLNEISTSGKYLKDPQIVAIDNMIRAIHYLEKGRIDIQNEAMIYTLLNTIIKCICSNYFIDMFEQAVQLEKFDEGQTFLLDTCTDYICWHKDNRYNEICTSIRTALLNTFVTWLQNHFPLFQQWTKMSIKVMGQLYITLINGNARDDETYSQQDHENYCTMIDIFLTILDTIMESNSMNESLIALIRILTQGLYSLTMTNDIRSYIKNKQMIPLLLNLINIEDEMTQFHVYRILASIMTEKDIKTLHNSNTIAYVFLTFLTKLIDDSSMTPRFHSLLRSLKILVQHDQIKEELTKQGILSLLIRCATETKYDPIKAQQPAIEILLALTFNDEAANQLKKNTQFISKLKILITSTTKHFLKRAAESLIWELEKSKSDTSLITIDVNTQKYDIMLSYSHSDKDLCYHIHDRLIKDQYRVWLDREYMHGATMVAMANAIENSEFVLICMSDAYKQSAYCQSEAHYAFERRRYLIPLIMKSYYRPDGWLGIMASGKMYIDFPKLGFDLAYERLKNEIDQHHKTKPTEQLQRNPTKNDNLKSSKLAKEILFKSIQYCSSKGLSTLY